MGSCHGRHSVEQFSHKKSVYQAHNYRQMEGVMKVRYPGSKLHEALPILFPHNLYSYNPSSSLSTRLYNGTISTARLVSSITGFLFGGEEEPAHE